MSGTHGRFPPALPPEGGWPPPADGGHTLPRTQPPPGQQPRQAQPGWPPMPPANAPQAPTFPPRFPPQQAAHGAAPHMAPPQGYDFGAHQRAPAMPDPIPPQQPAWSPQPPAPFPAAQGPATGRPAMPPQRPPLPQQGHGYPPQSPEIPRTEPPRRTDPASYDLGSYGLSPQQAPGQPPMPPRDLRQPMPPQPEQWQQQGGPSFGYPGATTPPQPQGFQQGGYPPSFGQPQHPPHLGGGAQPDADYQEDVEYEEQPRKRRRWLVMGALVGSIAVGSGMAYAYKLIFSPKSERSQVVRAPKDAAKATPGDRGGKQFPNADSRVNNNRLPSEGSSTAGGGGDGSPGFTNSSGVRVVQTIPVGPGSSAVPGMTIVGPGTGPGSTLPPAAMQPPPSNALPPAIPSQQAKMAAAPPQQSAAARAAARPAPQPEAEAPQRVARAEPPKTAAAAAPSGEAAAARPKAVSGYVAVLGFQRSQLDAMKMMADLQQKYDVLRDRKLEIVQSDQSARGLGTIYRVVVGPRGGITPAREVCSQLFQAGMPKQGCYPLTE